MYEFLNGVKQGCVLSPCLFNLIILDLDTLLTGTGGVKIDSTRLNGLYYADDIVLIADSENSLLEMLSVADIFAKKWGMKYNAKKSQILITGKKWSNKLWPLGENMLEESKKYKYLGYIFNRHITDTDHILDNLAQKAIRLVSHTRHVLSKHMDINRINFGNSIWNKAIVPSLSHAGGIWFNNTKGSIRCLKSLQYKCAKAVLKLNNTPSLVATLGELGWTPIIDHLDNTRVSYYTRLKDMESHRLPKIIYDELLSLHNRGVQTKFKYFEDIKSIFMKNGADYLMDDDENYIVQRFKSLNYDNYVLKFFNSVEEMSSLKYFRHVKIDTYCSEYLLKSETNFKSAQLKFKLRTGTAGIGEDLTRQNRGPGNCHYCGEFESLKHLLFHCPAYNNERQLMYSTIHELTDDVTFSSFIQNQDTAICYLLGDHDDVFNRQFLHFITKVWNIRNMF